MEAFKSRILRGYVRIREGGKGQGYVEYILIIAFIGIAVTAALTAFKNQISSAFNTVGGSL